MIRLDKYLADAGIGTRSQVKQYLKKGMVTVNGEVEQQPKQKVTPGADLILFQGKEVSYSEYEYYMLNKPAGCVSATKDLEYKTVLDYIDSLRDDLFPVGRLDRDTEGLLLITNDGALSHRLLSPVYHVPKTYYIKVSGCVPKEAIERCRLGLDIGDDAPTKPAFLEILSAGEVSELLLTITEGRYHQVKRMCHVLGHPVEYLKRVSFGPLTLDASLALGQYRPLTPEEITQLKDEESICCIIKKQ